MQRKDKVTKLGRLTFQFWMSLKSSPILRI